MASLTFRADLTKVEGSLRTQLEATAVREDVQRRARNVRDRARQNAVSMMAEPSGRLASSVRYATRRVPDGWAAQVGSDLPYAIWVHEGTGEFGPTGRPIHPHTARFMHFVPRGGTAFVFARSVVGQPGKPFLAAALPAALL